MNGQLQLKEVALQRGIDENACMMGALRSSTKIVCGLSQCTRDTVENEFASFGGERVRLGGVYSRIWSLNLMRLSTK